MNEPKAVAWLSEFRDGSTLPEMRIDKTRIQHALIRADAEAEAWEKMATELRGSGQPKEYEPVGRVIHSMYARVAALRRLDGGPDAR